MAELPPCFSPTAVVCPHCQFVGGAKPTLELGYCFHCAKPVTVEDVHVFGPSVPGLTARARGELKEPDNA